MAIDDITILPGICASPGTIYQTELYAAQIQYNRTFANFEHFVIFIRFSTLQNEFCLKHI